MTSPLTLSDIAEMRKALEGAGDLVPLACALITKRSGPTVGDFCRLLDATEELFGSLTERDAALEKLGECHAGYETMERQLAAATAEIARLTDEIGAALAEQRESLAQKFLEKKEIYVEGVSAVDVRLSYQTTYKWRDGPAIAAAIREGK